MRFLLVNHIQNARDSLRANRMRTFLTILGVAIGVASIVAILALGGGASRVVEQQVDLLGGNIAVIRPSETRKQDLTELTLSQSQQNFAASTLTIEDVQAIRDIPGVAAVSPIMILSGAFKADDAETSSIVTVATTPDFAKINQLTIQEGQFHDTSNDSSTAVLGAQASVDLFGTEQSIGKVFSFRGTPLRVIGIIERQNTPINFNNVDIDDAVFIQFETGVVINDNNSQIQQINVMAESVSDLDRVMIDTRKVLLERHEDQNDFIILAGSEIAQPASQVFFAIASATAAIAAISLLVGGVGIMNIMLVNVAERSREVGIRKALGATHGDIAWQFLVESFIMATLGGIAGCAVGYSVAFIVSIFLTFDPLFDWKILVVGMATSAIIGTVFGLYPAIRAARKHPIESLGHYT